MITNVSAWLKANPAASFELAHSNKFSDDDTDVETREVAA
jgi:hypothetical protein